MISLSDTAAQLRLDILILCFSVLAWEQATDLFQAGYVFFGFRESLFHSGRLVFSLQNEYMKDNFLIKIETWHKPDMGHQENVSKDGRSHL